MIIQITLPAKYYEEFGVERLIADMRQKLWMKPLRHTFFVNGAKPGEVGVDLHFAPNMVNNIVLAARWAEGYAAAVTSLYEVPE